MTGIFTVHLKNALIKHVCFNSQFYDLLMILQLPLFSVKSEKNRVKNVNQNQKYFQGDSCIMRHKGTHTRTLTHTHTV